MIWLLPAARRTICLLVAALALAAAAPSAAQPGPGAASATAALSPSTPTPGAWGDQGNGTYANPIMPGDFSDLDAIRVGDDFYAITSTFYYSPGVAVLHSKDLVNWEIIGHVVDDLTAIDPELNWDRMSRRGRGIWAGSIRFHAGRFWVYFGTPDQGFFMSTAARAAGPWTPLKTVLKAPGWDDPCPFWDDDGQGYFVATHFAPEGPAGTKYNIHLFRMNTSGDQLLPGSDRILHQSRGSEANKLYKIHGVYFHYYSEVAPEGRVIMMERSRSLDGPWETRQLIHVHPQTDKEPNQGGLIQLASGKWFFVSHQGRGDWEGRAGVLLPVNWTTDSMGGWPIIGAPGPDGIGNMVWSGPKPVAGFPLTNLSASDEFDGPQLKPNWEWNYQPRPGKWSLTERRGFLRLYAFPALGSASMSNGGLPGIGNVLTQRSLRSRHSDVIVKLDLSGNANGQEAGIAHYSNTFCTVSVLHDAAGGRLYFTDNSNRTPGLVITGTQVWLRSEWDYDGVNQFSYSLDGDKFLPAGPPCRLAWGSYRGDRIGIFTTGPKGYVDVDFFHYEVAR